MLQCQAIAVAVAMWHQANGLPAQAFEAEPREPLTIRSGTPATICGLYCLPLASIKPTTSCYYDGKGHWFQGCPLGKLCIK